MNGLLLVLLCILPHDTAARDTFDAIEVQDFYSWQCTECKNGDTNYAPRFTFTQLLFRTWRKDTHEIDAWRMSKPGMQPQWNHAQQCYEVHWFDGEKERIVRAKSLVYSSSDFDSEVVERERWGKEMRRELRR